VNTQGAVAIARTGRYRHYVLRALVVMVIVAVGVLAGLQWSRPIPSPVFHPDVSNSIRLPGRSPTLPWPATGSAALSMEGVGSLGHVGSTKPVPIASITKVMTAYVVLKDHPLSPGADGPAIPVTAAVVADYQAGLASQQSVVQVSAGESLTELQALEGLLIPSGNDLATLLADWDAGSTTAFIAKMNSTAQTLGLTATHFNDASGLDPGSTSTPTDLIKLGEAAMALPTFSQIVSLGEITLPEAGLVYNFDYDLGRDGIIGIKTGTDSAAGGCFLFEAQKTVDGKKMTIVGAVLGQQTVSPITAVLSSVEGLAQAAFADMGTIPLVAPGQLIGKVTTPWGASVGVRAPHAQSVVGWPGLSVPTRLEVSTLPRAVGTDTPIGSLKVNLDGRIVDVPLRASGRLRGPSAIWRLTRF
jgi:D-alanyl-D-alanine carboxypeptidase (penicillin-binding protein 5/6)